MSARVQQAYFTLFGRPADPAGLAFWDNASASMSDGQLYEALVASPEFQALGGEADTTARLTEIYQNAFGRVPDADGLAFWLAAVAADGGDSAALARAAASIVGTPAAGSDDALSVANKTQVAIALTDALSGADHAKSIDAGTLAAAKALLAGTGSAALPNAATLEADIAEAVQTVAIDTLAKVNATVQTLYVAVFGRPADPDGLVFWGNALEALGGDASALATQFISADNAEFAATYGAVSADEFLAAIYQNLTGRAPDADGANFWKSGIENLNNTGESALTGFAAVAAQIVQAVAAHPTSTDASVAKNSAAVAQSFTEQLVKQAGPDADFSNLSPAALADARELLGTVTADPASVAQAQDKVAEVVKAVLEQAGVPVVNPPVVIPPVVTPPVVTPPTTLALTVDATLANDNPATGAFKTIQAAIDAVGEGRSAVIKIAAGTYQQDLVLKSGITLDGNGVVKVLSAGGDVAVQAENANNITIRNVTFEQTNSLAHQLKFANASGIMLHQVTVSGTGSDTGTGIYLNGVSEMVLAQTKVQGYGQTGIAVVAKDAEAGWNLTKNLAFIGVSVFDNGTGIAFDTRGTGVFADPLDAESDINGVTFGGSSLISGNDTGIRFGETGGLKAVHGELLTPPYGDPYWDTIKLHSTAFNGNATQVVSNDRTYPTYIIEAGDKGTTVDFNTNVELVGDVPQLVTFTEAASYRVGLSGSANLDLQRNSSTVWLTGASERDTRYKIDVKSSGSDLNFSSVSVTQEVQLKLSADALQNLEITGVWSSGRIVLDEASQLAALKNVKLSFLTSTDFVLNLQDAEQSIKLSANYEVSSIGVSRVNYTSSQHGDTLNVGGRYGSVYTLGDGDDVISYLGSTQYIYPDPTQLPIAVGVSAAGLSRIGTRDSFSIGQVDAFDTIRNFGQSDLLKISKPIGAYVFDTIDLGVDGIGGQYAPLQVDQAFAAGTNVVFASLSGGTAGYLFVDMNGNGLYDAARDFAVKIELTGGVTFGRENLEFFAEFLPVP